MFIRSYEVSQSHIDVQGIVDGLYIPFYFEWCRHAYASEVLGFDLAARAKEGVNMVLVELTIRFKSAILFPGSVEVSCRAESDGPKGITLRFIQELREGDKLCATGVFIATCTSPSARRPFIPADVLANVPPATAP